MEITCIIVSTLVCQSFLNQHQQTNLSAFGVIYSYCDLVMYDITCTDNLSESEFINTGVDFITGLERGEWVNCCSHAEFIR